MGRAVIVEAVRTPRGRGRPGKGTLSGVHPQELMAQTLAGLMARTGVPPTEVEDVVVGCVTQAQEQGANLARNAVLAAGWPLEVTGVTLNRFCASGLQAVANAAYGVASGFQRLVVAGGVESMSRVPFGTDGGGLDGGNTHLRARLFQVPQGISADLIATRERIGRAELDAYALASQQRAVQALEEGRFARSLVAVRAPGGGPVLLERDESPRPDTTAAGLAALPPAFAALGASASAPGGPTLDALALAAFPDVRRLEHVHTAGSSSGLADGAAALLVASEDYARAHGLRARARVRAVATAGSDPVLMLTGPTPACRRALAQAGLAVGDVDLWEINEAFSVVPLQTMRALGVDPARVNVNGGAIALGHPLGATGAVLLGTLLDELERRSLAVGVVTLCIGGGQGMALVVERV